MWHCPDCGQSLEWPVAHNNPVGETCDGHPQEVYEPENLSLGKRIADAFFTSAPFSATFVIAFLATQMAYPVILLAAATISIGSLIFAALSNKNG